MKTTLACLAGFIITGCSSTNVDSDLIAMADEINKRVVVVGIYENQDSNSAHDEFQRLVEEKFYERGFRITSQFEDADQVALVAYGVTGTERVSEWVRHLGSAGALPGNDRLDPALSKYIETLDWEVATTTAFKLNLTLLTTDAKFKEQYRVTARTTSACLNNKADFSNLLDAVFEQFLDGQEAVHEIDARPSLNCD